MTFNNNLPTTEPAFLSHEKYIRQRPRGVHKSLNDCCYSLSNLALIVASIVALVFCVKFLNDDPLYEYGEHLLTLKFYRYIIFIIVILPLTLLIPLANAAAAFFVSGSRKAELGSSVLGVKIFYQVVLVILVFVGLIFIAPSIRHSNVATQMEMEIRRHMKWRYDNEFSYEFLDRIQAEYECCDELWYRSNFYDKIPLSCYQPDGTYSMIHTRSCSDALGSLVSTRCIVIAACLVVIILALALLIGIDAVEMTSSGSSRHYDIREREASFTGHDGGGGGAETTSLSSRRNSREELDTRNDERDELVEELTNRLRMREREREIPLLPKGNSSSNHRRRFSADDRDDHEGSEHLSPISSPESGGAILTRANYHQYNNRPRSPVFVRTPDSSSEPGPSSSGCQPVSAGGTSPRSVLKKTSSFQTIDSDSDGCESDRRTGQQRGALRDSQTRRSLLNVRFAD